MVIDTDVRFNSLFSSLTDPRKISELKTECEKVLSHRGVSLLFQHIKIPSEFFQWFYISEEDFSQAVGNETTQIRRNLLAAYALDSKLITISMLIRIYQCIFSKSYVGVKADIINETKRCENRIAISSIS